MHSPSLGPGSWGPLTAELRTRARQVVVPSLLGVADKPPPAWPHVVEAVARATAGLPADAPVALVVHRNAGLFVPVLVERSDRRRP